MRPQWSGAGQLCLISAADTVQISRSSKSFSARRSYAHEHLKAIWHLSGHLAACVSLHAADKCTQSTLCTEITDAIWSGLLSDLTSYGQGSADASWSDYLISAINTTFSVLDPKV